MHSCVNFKNVTLEANVAYGAVYAPELYLIDGGSVFVQL